MADVKREGGVDREILVTLDPRMQAFGVTAPQVNQALRVLNLNAAGGARKSAARAIDARAGQCAGCLCPVADQVALAAIVVKLTDIATVQDSFGEITSLAKLAASGGALLDQPRARGFGRVGV
jgi:multidrug efflux pump subunit AcrB